MDWERYKRLCDRPDVWSRWMLEQTVQLVDDPRLAAALRLALAADPLPKPADHRGGSATDMITLRLTVAERGAVLRWVRAARNAGRVTHATAGRGLGGFVEAWQEYFNWRDGGDERMGDDKAVVLELIDAFNSIDLDRILACFTEDAVYHNMPMDAVQGTAAIRRTLEGFMSSASRVQWDLLNVVAADGVVLTERVDKFEVNGTWIELPVMGTFEVTGGKITAWRDYFDLPSFQTQMAKATGG